MEQKSNEIQQLPVPCRNGCGFFSSNATEGLCSVCYKKKIEKKKQPQENVTASDTTSKSVETATPKVSSTPEQTNQKNEPDQEGVAAAALENSFKETNSSEDEKESSGKKKKNRCLNCKKKLGLTGFSCRCGGLFCSLHRYSDEHACDFDYKKLGAEEIKKSNPVIVAK